MAGSQVTLEFMTYDKVQCVEVTFSTHAALMFPVGSVMSQMFLLNETS